MNSNGLVIVGRFGLLVERPAPGLKNSRRGASRRRATSGSYRKGWLLAKRNYDISLNNPSHRGPSAAAEGSTSKMFRQFQPLVLVVGRQARAVEFVRLIRQLLVVEPPDRLAVLD